MKTKTFKTFLEQCENDEIEIDDFLQKISKIEGVEDQILIELEHYFEKRNWSTLQLLVLAAGEKLSSKYVEILCEILLEGSEHMNNEDIVVILDELEDEKAIPALSKAIQFEFEDDESHHLNLKCIDALANIGGDMAIDVIKNAVDSSFDEVKEMAQRYLDYHGYIYLKK